MTELEQLQAQKRALQRDAQRAEALRRLQNNPDFVAVVQDGFLRDAPLAALDDSVRCCERDARGECLQKARASAFLQDYFAHVARAGEYAQRHMREMEAAVLRARNTRENG